MDQVAIYKTLVEHLGGPTNAAKLLGVKQGTASGWIGGAHGMSAHIAIKAEAITHGKFKASDLNEKLRNIEDTTAA